MKVRAMVYHSSLVKTFFDLIFVNFPSIGRRSEESKEGKFTERKLVSEGKIIRRQLHYKNKSHVTERLPGNLA